MQFSWMNQTSDSNRLAMIGIAITMIVVVVGGFSFITDVFKDRANSQAATSETAGAQNGQAVTGTQTDASASRNSGSQTKTTQTTTRGGITQAQVEHPEASQLSAEQLAFSYNQRNSGLTPRAYQTATDVAKAFVIADTTGQDTAKYPDYYKYTPNEPWLKDVRLVYVTAMRTEDPTVVKGLAWFSGTRIVDNRPVSQMQQGFFMKRSTEASLEFSPFYPETPTMDPDIGLNYAG